ncbi:MAG: glycosyltransferase family 4 protein [Pseudomonadota bacterium]
MTPITPLSILHTESSIGWGGQEIRILTEARGLLDRGHRVMLLTPGNAEMLPAAREMGVPATALSIGKKRLPSLLAMRAWLASNMRGVDVINTHSSTDSWLAAASCATLSNPPPIVRTRHVSTAINNHWSTRWLYTKATQHIVSTGEALRQQLHRDNGYALDRMTSVRTGIDLQRFKPLDKRQARAQLAVSDSPAIGILATLRDWKGHNYLFDAMKLLAHEFPEWKLIVIGDGPQRQRLEARVRDEMLGNTVRFVGNVDNVPEWLSTLDLFALPSYGDEGVPQGIMQAMACGLPVISTPVGAIGEAVQDGVTGFMVETRSAVALAHALGLLMRDTTLRNKMGEASLMYAQQQFGIDVMIDKMLVVFAQQAKQQRGKN